MVLFLLALNNMKILRLAIMACLRGKLDGLLSVWGVCCSSRVTTSRGSTGRSFLTPMGFDGHTKFARQT